jgi:hypothetical protein
LIRQARQLGIPLPNKPVRQDAELNADPNWSFNHHNGNWYFTENKELELRQKVRRESDERFAHSWNRFGGFLSALTFAVLVVNAYLYYRQAKIMGTQAEIMQRTLPLIGQQADAATSAANTASSTLQESQKSFRIDQRPYLVTETPQFVGPGPVANQIIQANVTFRNIGRTPAIKIFALDRLLSYRPTRDRQRFVTFLRSTFAALDAKDIAGRKGLKDSPEEQDIAPNGTFFTTSQDHVLVASQEFPNVQTGAITFFYVGEISYTDAFNASYTTHFCYFYFGPNPTTWHVCDAYNSIQ